MICSDKTNSVLKSDNVTDFSWHQVWFELLMYMPPLALFLKELLPNSSSGNRRVICLIMSMIIKSPISYGAEGHILSFTWEICTQKGILLVYVKNIIFIMAQLHSTTNAVLIV